MRVVVIGAGATGLAAAYLLARAGHEVLLTESAPLPGGLLATFDAGGGARLEYFYHHFFTHDAEINWLLGELKLADRVAFRPTAMGVARGGALHPFDGIRDLLRFSPISLMARLRFGFSSAMLAYLPGYADAETTPALRWLERWAGRAATDAIWRPLFESKFGDIADRVPLAWMAGRLRQRARSRRGGEERLGYLAGSLQVLVDTLVADLQQRGVLLYLSNPVTALIREEGQVVGAATPAGELYGDAVLVTTPTPALAKLVQPLDAGYATALNRIEYLGAMCTVLALRQPLSNIYWLNVADPGYDFGGVIEQTNFVPASEYGGRHLVYLSRYLTTDKPLWSMPDAELVDRQLTQLERLFGKPVRPDVTQSWVFRGRYAAPRTEIGFHELIPAFRSPLPGLFAATMCHVYPDERSVNNSIRVAAEAVRALGLTHAADAVPRNLSLSAKYGAG